MVDFSEHVRAARRNREASEQDALQAEITKAVEKGLVEAMRPLLDVPPFHVLRHLPAAALNSMAVAAVSAYVKARGQASKRFTLGVELDDTTKSWGA